MIRQVIQRISDPEASVESLQERRFWLQCEYAYTWQPIYQTCGRLMAMGLLTVVAHPLNPSQHLPPDHYFTEITVNHRMEVVKEQISLLAQKADFFVGHDLLASVNIDGLTLIVLRQQPKILHQIERLPWLRFELIEHIRLPKDSTFASMCEFSPLWLDDFGTGMANFPALSEVCYDYIKIARELFVMLRQSPKRRTLSSQLLHLVNRYCRGVIVEGVEAPGEWRDAQNSPVFVAQGWFLLRPTPIETLNTAILTLWTASFSAWLDYLQDWHGRNMKKRVMSKASEVTAAISGTFLLLIVMAITLIVTSSWNRLRPTINQKVSAELSRPFAIRGDLGVVWERQRQETG